MNPSLSKTENSWERGASFTTNVAVSSPESGNRVLFLHAFHVLIKVKKNSTVSKRITDENAGRLR